MNLAAPTGALQSARSLVCITCNRATSGDVIRKLNDALKRIVNPAFFTKINIGQMGDRVLTFCNALSTCRVMKITVKRGF